MGRPYPLAFRKRVVAAVESGGLSRGTANKTTEFNRASGRHYFNLAASGDSPIGFVQKARWLIKTQTNLRDVVFFLSFD